MVNFGSDGLPCDCRSQPGALESARFPRLHRGVWQLQGPGTGDLQLAKALPRKWAGEDGPWRLSFAKSAASGGSPVHVPLKRMTQRNRTAVFGVILIPNCHRCQL